VVVVRAVLLPSTTWCIPHLGVSCIDHNSNRIGAIAHNSTCGNFSSNNTSSTVHLLHCRSRLPSHCHSSFPPATFHASTAGKWATLLENALCPSKATHHELQHPWSISRGVIRRVLHHRWVMAIAPPWRRFPSEKKC
jgi:hypothetical protein